MGQNEDDFEVDESLYKEFEAKITLEEQRETDNRMLLAKRISTAMKAKGWKQIDLSKGLKKDPAIISRWLSGTHSFNVETLWEIESVLDIGLVDIGKKDIELAKLAEQVNSKDDIIKELKREMALLKSRSMVLFNTAGSDIQMPKNTQVIQYFKGVNVKTSFQPTTSYPTYLS